MRVFARLNIAKNLLDFSTGLLYLLGFAIRMVLNQNRMTGGFFWVRCNEVAREGYEG